MFSNYLSSVWNAHFGFVFFFCSYFKLSPKFARGSFFFSFAHIPFTVRSVEIVQQKKHIKNNRFEGEKLQHRSTRFQPVLYSVSYIVEQMMSEQNSSRTSHSTMRFFS